jgi:hypothetical protein
MVKNIYVCMYVCMQTERRLLLGGIEVFGRHGICYFRIILSMHC